MSLISTALELIDALPVPMLLPLLLLSLAPFAPEPHLVEKTRMLFQGTLRKPIDILDFFMHGIPAFILLVRASRVMRQG